MLAASILQSLLNNGSGFCCKKDDFFEKINKKNFISNFKLMKFFPGHKLFAKKQWKGLGVRRIF